MISTQKTLLFATTSRHCDKYSNQKRERENDIKIDLIVYCTAESGPPHQQGPQQTVQQTTVRDLLLMSRPNDLILVPNRQNVMNFQGTGCDVNNIVGWWSKVKILPVIVGR